MKRACATILAVYFLLGSLTPKMDYNQWLHLTDAIEHYAEHQVTAQQKGETFSFIDFIMDHYLDPDNHDHDTEKEQHPCTHTHVTAFNWVEMDNAIPVLTGLQQSLSGDVFSAPSLFHAADFTRGIDHPPANA